MDLQLPEAGLERYKSASQRARVGTEAWGAANFFCPACKCPRLRATQQGTAVIDYRCPSCDSPFQLKSQSRPIGARLVDAAYSKMRHAILEDRTPNLFVMHYDREEWAVQTVILVPCFAFTLSAVERRKPLAPTARRAGWVGCDIVLDKIPLYGRIAIIRDRKALPKKAVRAAYRRLRPFQGIRAERRGWTLDVLQVVQSLGTPEFTLDDVYAHADALAKLHPKNVHVHAKIRQQLQVLRDMHLLKFLGGGRYRLD